MLIISIIITNLLGNTENNLLKSKLFHLKVLAKSKGIYLNIELNQYYKNNNILER